MGAGLRSFEQASQGGEQPVVGRQLGCLGLELAERGQQKPFAKRAGFFGGHPGQQRQYTSEVIGQFGRIGQTIAAELALEPDEKLPARVLFAEQVPANVETAVRVHVKCLDIALLEHGQRQAGRFPEEGLEFAANALRRLAAGSGECRRGRFGRIFEQPRQRVVDFRHSPLLGPARKPNPAPCLCSSGSVIIWMASSRCIGGMTKRSSKVHSEVRR